MQYLIILILFLFGFIYFHKRIERIEELVFSKKHRHEDYPENDPLYPQAKEYAIQNAIVSASILQRHLNIGYARASRLMDLLKRNRVVKNENRV